MDWVASHGRSTLITTNTAFSDWGNILYNTTIATTIADRLVENSEIFLLGGERLRRRNTLHACYLDSTQGSDGILGTRSKPTCRRSRLPSCF
jgi:hypothetical protein